MITFSNIGRNGRMGNQMFQYAFLVGVATRNNFEYGVPYSNKSDNEFQHFCLPDCFSKLKAKDSSGFINRHYILDHDWVFNEKFFNVPDDTNFCGYFQSEKYFKDCRNDLLQQFNFSEEIKNKSNRYFSSEEKNISLHIRLGDYLTVKEHHPVCSIEYYNKALELIPKEKIYVFTDDVSMAKSIFSNQFKNREVFYPETENKFVDMYIMTQCKYHILANSSFSWWGAWLANSNKVIAPNTWFGPASHIQGRHHDIYCEGWEVI